MPILSKTISTELEEGVQFDMQVEFEWVPPICKRCCSFGHQDIHYHAINVWVPKENNQGIFKPETSQH